MKQLFSLILAGMAGGMITLGGYSLLLPDTPAAQVAPFYAQAAKNINVPAHLNAVPFDFKTAAARAMPAVVHISSIIDRTASNAPRSNDPFHFFFGDDFNPFGNGTPPQGGTGSGVIYTSDGYIVTNNHVVQNAGEVEVTLYDNRTFQAKVIGTDEKSDVAVIKIEGYDFPTLDLSNSAEAEIG